MQLKRFPVIATLGTTLLVGTFALLALFAVPAHRASADSPSFVRIIHASPDIGAADVFVDGKKLLSNFEFGTITPYAPIPPGPHDVKVALIGTGIDAATISQSIDVQAGVPYTVAALGTKAMGFSLEVFIDNNLVSSGNAKVRLYHLSPGTGAVNVALHGTTLASGLGYQQASSYASFQSGAYTFDVQDPQDNTTLPVSTTLATNTVTSVFAIGLMNGTPKIQFVTAQVNGLPGVPGTGSDPGYRPVRDGVQTTWLPEALFLLLLVGSFSIWRLALVRRSRS